MTDLQQTIMEHLEVARDLIGERRLDIESTLTMLKALPDDIGDDVRSSVEQALQTAAAAVGQDSRHEAMARFALARVIVLLEKHSADPEPTRRPRLLSHASDGLDADMVSPRLR